jgi:hypothetical protein
MMTMVLAAGRRGDCLRAGEVKEGGDGADGASMGHESGDCTERVGAVQLCRVSRIFPRVRPGEISRHLLALTSLTLGKPPIRTFPLGLYEGCFSAR